MVCSQLLLVFFEHRGRASGRPDTPAAAAGVRVNFQGIQQKPSSWDVDGGDAVAGDFLPWVFSHGAKRQAYLHMEMICEYIVNI